MSTSADRSSIFQLFKRFSGPKVVEVSVSAYGKLPVYKDFLRHGLAGAEAQAFKRWLDRGISKFWQTHEKYRGQEIPDQAVMLSFPATGKQILGYLWDSHDEGGLRRFPFTLFVSLPASGAAAPLALVDALEQVVDQARSLRRRLAGLADHNAFFPLLRTARFRLEIHTDRVLRERLDHLEEPSVERLGEALYGERASELWPVLLDRLARARKHPDLEFAGRLPRAGILSVTELAMFWLLLLGPARRNTRKPLQLLYGPEREEAGITLLHRDLRSDDVFTFHPEMPDYDAIRDLRKDVPGEPKGLPEALREAPFGALVQKKNL